jgi:hypothetical protein
MYTIKRMNMNEFMRFKKIMLKNIIILLILSSCVSDGFHNEPGELQKKEELKAKLKAKITEKMKDNVDVGLSSPTNIDYSNITPKI